MQEVEAALGALQGVCQVVTAVVKNPATEQDYLVAWLSPKDLHAHSLVQQLQGSLPEYMCPTVVVLMDQLPLLVSEKVDRKALPAPDFATDMVSPTTAPASAAAGHASAGSSSGSGLDSYSTQELDPLSKFVSAVWVSKWLGRQLLSVSTLSCALADMFSGAVPSHCVDLTATKAAQKYHAIQCLAVLCICRAKCSVYQPLLP
jgi:hypothetical protein